MKNCCCSTFYQVPHLFLPMWFLRYIRLFSFSWGIAYSTSRTTLQRRGFPICATFASRDCPYWRISWFLLDFAHIRILCLRQIRSTTARLKRELADIRLPSDFLNRRRMWWKTMENTNVPFQRYAPEIWTGNSSGVGISRNTFFPQWTIVASMVKLHSNFIPFGKVLIMHSSAFCRRGRVGAKIGHCLCISGLYKPGTCRTKGGRQ